MKQKIAELLGEAGMKYPWIEKLDLVCTTSKIEVFRLIDFYYILKSHQD